MLKRIVFLLLLTLAAQARPVTVPLRTGWNPVAFQGPRVESLTTNAAGQITFSEGSYRTGNLTVDEVNAGAGGRRGFWVYSTGEASLSYSTSEANTGLNLTTGWNLVSSATDQVTAGLVVPSPVLPTGYELQPDGTSVPASLANGLKPGRAYWIFSTGPAQLTWGAPAPSPSPAPSLAALAVTPAQAAVTRYGTVQLKAVGTLADGSQTDVTSQVAWSSEVPSAVAVSSSGLATALFPTTVRVTASLAGREAATNITVTDAGAPPPPQPSPPNFRRGRAAGAATFIPGSTSLTGNYISTLPAGSFIIVVATSTSGVPTNIRDGGGNTYQVLTTVSGGGTHMTLAVCTRATAPTATLSCDYPPLPADSFAFMNGIELLGGLTGVDVVANGVFGPTTRPVSPTLRTTRTGEYLFSTFAAYNNGGSAPGGTFTADPGNTFESGTAGFSPGGGLRENGLSQTVYPIGSYVLSGTYATAVPYNCVACSLY